MPRPALTTALGLVALLGAASADARSGGHPGATGRPEGGTCNRCHSPGTYVGAHIMMPQRYRRDCVRRQADGSYLVEDSFWVVERGKTIPLTLVVPEPPQGEGGLYCPEGDTCGPNVVGIDIEVTGLSETPEVPLVLRPASGESGMKQAPRGGGAEAGAEVVHSEPRAFENGTARFLLELDTRGLLLVGGMTLYGSANACNGNGQADLGDVTSTLSESIFLANDSGGHNGPNCNEAPVCPDGAYLDADLSCTCPDGTEAVRTDDSGNDLEAPYCGAVQGCSAAATPTLWGLVTLLGLLRRRRRR